MIENYYKEIENKKFVLRKPSVWVEIEPVQKLSELKKGDKLVRIFYHNCETPPFYSFDKVDRSGVYLDVLYEDDTKRPCYGNPFTKGALTGSITKQQLFILKGNKHD